MSGPSDQPSKTIRFLNPTLSTGLLLLLLSVGVVFFAGENFLAIGLGWFVFLIAIMLVMMGALQNQPFKKPETAPTATFHEITREIVKVRCSHCGSLNFETSTQCSNCGANL